MDAVVSSAVEEICSLGQNGLALCNLWSKLEPSLSASGLDLSNGVKAAVWTQLLRVPSLQFEAGKGLYDAKDPSIQSFEAAERLNLKVVAKVHLRDSFVGLYNVRSASSNMSAHQRRVLERLAGARYVTTILVCLTLSSAFDVNVYIYNDLCHEMVFCLRLWGSFMDKYD